MSDSKPLTVPQLTAAKLLVEGKLTIAEVASSVDVDERTVYRWREWPDFIEEMRRISDAYEDGMVREGQAIKRIRINALNRQIRGIESVIEARSKLAETDDTLASQGGASGFVVVTKKGAAGVIVTEYAVDSALLKELREHQKQLAVEVGQWVEKVAPTDPSGNDEFGNLTDDDRASRALALLNLARERAVRQTDGPEARDAVGSESGAADTGD